VERRTLNELRAGAPLRVAGATIVPLERWHVIVASDGRRVFAGADKQAAGVVVVDSRGTLALDEAGGPLDLDALIDRAVGLRELL
jgi:hypothetical protein